MQRAMYRLEVTPTIVFVEGGRRGRFPYGNSLVVEGSEARVVVDTGAGEEVLNGLLASGPFHVVINTHYHIDHMRGNRLLTGAEFWCPRGEEEALTSLEGFIRFTGFDLQGPQATAFIRDEVGWRPTPVSRGLEDGELLDFGGVRARVLRLPGHTPGHTGLWFEEERVLFTADIDMSTFGPWYGDVFSGVDDYLESLDRVETLVRGAGRDLTILTSHRRPLDRETFLDRLGPFRARFQEREERIIDILAREGRPLALVDIVARRPVYGPRVRFDPGIHKSEFFMVRHHLERLARAGRVARVAPELEGAAVPSAPASPPAEGAGPSAPGTSTQQTTRRETEYGGSELWRLL